MLDDEGWEINLNEKNILFIEVNHPETSRIPIDEELRKIEIKMKGTPYFNSVKLIHLFAMRTTDLTQKLREKKPVIVHFSGHGTESGELIFIDDKGAAKAVSPKAIKNVLKEFRDDIKLVLLNACYTRPAAEAIIEEIDCAIGMNKELGSNDAAIFASEFYGALCSGCSVQEAFNQAKGTLGLEENNSPETNNPMLFVKGGVNASEIFPMNMTPKNIGKRREENGVVSINPQEVRKSIYSEKIDKILNKSKFSEWFLSIIRENGISELDEMLKYLSGVDGVKKILSGYSYWGIVPTGYWILACRDINYLMAKSIRQFPEKWGKIYSFLTDKVPYNYVSLGVGDGQKDYFVLRDLIKKNPNISYFPVDMSPEMLYQGTKYVLDKFKWEPSVKKNQILAFQVNFEDQNRLREMRKILDELTDKQPIIFGLLGNTLANFDNDTNLLCNLSNILLNPKDLLLLELARIKNIEDDSMILGSKDEYDHDSFKTFALSSLIQATDIIEDDTWIEIEVDKEPLPTSNGKKALKILVWYINKSNEDLKIRRFHKKPIRFPQGDRIRLLLSRKYTEDGVNYLLSQSGLERSPHRASLENSLVTEQDNMYIDLLLLRKSR